MSHLNPTNKSYGNRAGAPKWSVHTTCQDGKFSGSTGAVECKNCPLNSISEENFSACSCLAGYQLSSAQCVKCAPGTYKNTVGTSQCELCNSAAQSSGTGKTCLCKPGFFVLSNSPAGNCSKCQAGSFSESPASPNCTSCAKGKFQAHDGESLCHACPPDSDTSTMARTSHCDCVCNCACKCVLLLCFARMPSVLPDLGFI